MTAAHTEVTRSSIVRDGKHGVAGSFRMTTLPTVSTQWTDYRSHKRAGLPTVSGCSYNGFSLLVFAEQHGALLELLEVPSLMESCVRAGSYDDALDLRAYCAKLALLHADLQARLIWHCT